MVGSCSDADILVPTSSSSPAGPSSPSTSASPSSASIPVAHPTLDSLAKAPHALSLAPPAPPLVQFPGAGTSRGPAGPSKSEDGKAPPTSLQDSLAMGSACSSAYSSASSATSYAPMSIGSL